MPKNRAPTTGHTKKTISITVDERIIEDVDMSRGKRARSGFIERVLWMFFNQGVTPQSESRGEEEKEEIKMEVAGMPKDSFEKETSAGDAKLLVRHVYPNESKNAGGGSG